jgi:hypothetical protein
MTTKDLCFSLLLSSAVLGFPGCGSTNNPAAQGGSRAGGTSGSTVGGAGGSSVGGAAGSSVGGGGGSSGGGAGGTTVASCINIADDLIADFTTDNGISQVDGRQGGFYVYGDASLAGQFDPPNAKCQAYPIDTTTGNPQCSGPGSFHVNASGWGVWGAALGTDFVPKITTDAADCDLGVKGTYDASKYRGISFWAKAAAPLKGVQVILKDVYTDGQATFAGLPVPDGTDPTFTSCLYMPDPKYNCSPYLVKFGADPQFFPAYQDYQIDTTWKRFDVFFADTRQDQYNLGFHAAASLDQSNLDVSHLTGMAIQVSAIYVGGAATRNDFEIWVDDINFIK